MYMSILHKPTDQDFDKYSHVLLNGIPLYWIIHIPTHMDTLFGHLTLQLGTSMI